jgi:hypothetical protein
MRVTIKINKLAKTYGFEAMERLPQDDILLLQFSRTQFINRIILILIKCGHSHNRLLVLLYHIQFYF